MKKILIALLVFIASLAALSFINRKQGGFTLLPNLPSTSEKEPSKPTSGSTDSPFREDPILEAKIHGIELLGIKGSVLLDENSKPKEVVFVAVIKNVQGLDSSERSFSAINKENGQRFTGTPSSFSDGYSVGTTQTPAQVEGGEKVSSMHFGLAFIQQGNGNIPPYGNYDVTFTFGFEGSKTKISITKALSYTETGIRKYTEGGFFG